MTITTAPRVDELIETLAAKAGDNDPVPLEIKSVAALTGDDLDRVWTEVVEAVEHRDSLINGLVHWSEVFDAGDLGWRDRHETACELAAEYAENAKALLLNGRR